MADTRIGFIPASTSFDDLSDPAKYDRTVNYVNRWNLQKANPDEAISEPKKPIVFWIDNAVPKQYRQAVREGVEMWNPVFEKEVGIRDAIVVKQMPDDADWDIADVRYNVVRWMVNMPFAISQARVNPLTGEVLNSCINMDAVFASSFAAKIDVVFGPGSQPPAVASFAHHNSLQGGDVCEQGVEQLNQMVNALDVLAVGDAETSKTELIHQYIRQVVAHEMGHTLGLRHNFTASTARTPAELSDPEVSRTRGLTASVMDYMPPNIFALKHPGVDYFSRMAGEYDHWAIHYGYMHLDAASPEAEVPALRKWASRGGEKGSIFKPTK